VTKSARFNMRLAPADRANLEAIRKRQGLRSEAEAIRWLIDNASYGIDAEARGAILIYEQWALGGDYPHDEDGCIAHEAIRAVAHKLINGDPT
jgi:hypothetical protein